MVKGAAFLVGIDEYQDDNLANLSPHATDDVNSIQNLLRSKFSQYVPQVVLTQQPITSELLEAKLEEFLTTTEYKNVLLYFSGHGYQILEGDTKRSKKHKGYLATYDSELFIGKDGRPDHQRYGLSFARLSELIADARHLNKLVLWIDACHSGLAVKYEVLRTALNELEPTFSYCILASSLGSEVSCSKAFTETLAEGLANKNLGQITADVISRYVRENLNNPKQRPVDLASGASDIVLMDYPTVDQKQVKLEPIRDEKGNPICPYRGLKYFEDDPDQQAFFFGRDRDIQKLRDRLNSSAFVPIIGASGSGKSSLVRAGLVRKQLRQDEAEAWQILPMIKPGKYPLGSLRRAFGSLMEKDRPLEDSSLIQEFVDNQRTLPELEAFDAVLAELRATGQKYLLVVDQFEEVFTLTRASEAVSQKHKQSNQLVEERDCFLELLTYVTQVQDCPLRVVITMRADFLGACLQYPTLKKLIEQEAMYVAPLVGAGLSDAIAKPAARQGYPLEPELVEALIRDVANEPGYLPLLAFTLEQLWQERVDEPKRCILLAAYRDLGATEYEPDEQEAGASGLRRALNLHADRVFEFSDFAKERPKKQRNPQEQEWIRLLFLRLLRTGQGETDMRQRQPRANLLSLAESVEARPRLDEVIGSLIESRLLVADRMLEGEEPGEVVDLAHEALIEGWKRFEEWRAEEREVRRTAEKLAEARRDWEGAEEPKKEKYLITRVLLEQVRKDWKRIRLYSLEREADEAFYRLSDQAEQAEQLKLKLEKLKLKLEVNASRVERMIEAKRPSLEILSLAAQTMGEKQEQLPEKLIGSVPACLRQTVAKLLRSPSAYGHSSSVRSVAFSPDGNTIVSGSDDNTIRLWKHMSPTSWLRTCCQRLHNNWTHDPDLIACRTCLTEEAVIEAEAGNFEAAIPLFEKAIATKARFLITSEATGETIPFHSAKADDPAKQAIQQQAKQKVVPYIIQQGEALARSGNYNQALEHFTLALEYDPHLDIDPTEKAKQLTIPILVMQAKIQNLAGDQDTAQQTHNQIKTLGPTAAAKVEAWFATH